MNPGKKIGTLTVLLDRKVDAWHCAKVKVDLRFDITTGFFHATYQKVAYQAKTKDELSAVIKQAAEKSIDMVWTRYLIVDYQATAWPIDGDSGRPESSGNYERLEINEDRAGLERDPDAERWDKRSDQRVITGVDLHWRVVDISQPYEKPEEPGSIVRSFRDVSMQLVDRDENTYEERAEDPREQNDDSIPAGAVPWTAEREDFLRSVLKALAQLDARMVELFRGAPEELADKFDARLLAGGADRLLTAGEQEARPMRAGSRKQS